MANQIIFMMAGRVHQQTKIRLKYLVQKRIAHNLRSKEM